MTYEEEYGGLLADYRHERRGLDYVLHSIAYELESIHSMVYTAHGSIQNDTDGDPEARVLLLAGNKAFRLCEEIKVMKQALYPDDSDDVGGAL